MAESATMPLVQIHGVDDVRIDQVALPVCGDDDIVVAVRQCGICGSDLSYIAMGGLTPPGQPMPIGHEMSAEVLECGANVSSVAVGDRVVVNPTAVEPQIGNSGPEGGFAPYLLVRDVAKYPHAVHIIPDSMDDRTGALVEPMSVGMHGVHQGEVTASDKVVVFGAGTIGLCITFVLRHYGCKDVVVVDTCEERLVKARQLGAHTFNPGSGDLAQALREWHGDSTYFGMPVPATDVYIEATGVGAVFEQMIAVARINARLVVVGLHKAPASLDLVTLLSKELSIRGSMAYPNEFPKVIEMFANSEQDPRLLITHDYPLAEFQEALAMARDQKQSVKVIVDCRPAQ